MHIQGLQKLTLLDYPGYVACTVFLSGCNFRCPFCHNASLVTHVDSGQDIPEEEVMAFLKKRSGMLDGICITGGEPLLAHDLEPFIRNAKKLGYKIKLDTNGSSPQRLKRLVETGLIDYVAMDIKNTPEKYGATIGIEGFDTVKIRESVEYLLSGPVKYEFRTTVVREFHKREDFEKIGQWISGADRYYLQSFADSGDLIQNGLHGYIPDIMKQALDIIRKYVPSAELRGVDE